MDSIREYVEGKFTPQLNEKIKYHFKQIRGKNYMKRTFANQTGNSNKIWIIDPVETSYAIEWGRADTKLRRAEKEFSSADECSKAVKKLCNEKIQKGYIEIDSLEVLPQKVIPAYRPMDNEIFWDIIASFNWRKEGDDEAVLKPAKKRLVALPVEDIQEFAEILAKKLAALDGKAYYDSNYGADYFLYVRACVVANGKAFYEDILKHPKKMPKDIDFEALLYLADEAYCEKLGLTGENEQYLETKVSYESFTNVTGWEGKGEQNEIR